MLKNVSGSRGRKSFSPRVLFTAPPLSAIWEENQIYSYTRFIDFFFQTYVQFPNKCIFENIGTCMLKKVSGSRYRKSFSPRVPLPPRPFALYGKRTKYIHITELCWRCSKLLWSMIRWSFKNGQEPYKASHTWSGVCELRVYSNWHIVALWGNEWEKLCVKSY